MGCHDGPVCAYEEALNIISEFILIANISPANILQKDNNVISNANGENNIQLGTTQFINTPLRGHLRYDAGSLPPPGKLVDVTLQDGKYCGKCVLEDDSHTCIFKELLLGPPFSSLFHPLYFVP